jgi:ATP-dependent DNA helicase RecG
MSDRPADYLVSLLCELCGFARETEWVEFKMNGAEPQAIGEHISVLTNSAALMGNAFAYLVWGVRDQDHALVGTTFDPRAARVGNEELESWLLRLLESTIDFRFFTVAVDGTPVVLLDRPLPGALLRSEFIRVGTYKKKLKDFPEKERALRRIFDQAPFEDGVDTERATPTTCFDSQTIRPTSTCSSGRCRQTAMPSWWPWPTIP